MCLTGLGSAATDRQRFWPDPRFSARRSPMRGDKTVEWVRSHDNRVPVKSWTRDRRAACISSGKRGDSVAAARGRSSSAIQTPGQLLPNQLFNGLTRGTPRYQRQAGRRFSPKRQACLPSNGMPRSRFPERLRLSHDSIAGCASLIDRVRRERERTRREGMRLAVLPADLATT
jgi:hypothetical protein